jgi:hypothetical protein
MRKFWRLLTNHVRQDFHRGYYLAVFLFLLVGILGNYVFKFDQTVVDRAISWKRIAWQFALFVVAFYVPLFLLVAIKRPADLRLSRSFWLLSLTGLGLLALKTGFPYLSEVTRAIFPEPQVFSWAYRVCNNALGFVTGLVPLLLLHQLTRARSGFYGLSLKTWDARPYAWLLLLIVPLVTIASFEPGFQAYYPMYKPNQVAATLHWPTWVPPLVYELVYGLDFINVELLFRGFLVIGLSQYLGRNGVLLMACAYCFLHFGKPWGECVSSVFGGYLLGVLAFETRNIWGGILLHITLAWGMELAAYLQKMMQGTSV